MAAKIIFFYFCDLKNRDMKKALFSLLMLLPLLFTGCKEPLVNPNYPTGIIDFTIDLNRPIYYDLRIVSGFMYLTANAESTSRGVIVYRLSQEEFRAYDRMPPNNPDCRDENGEITRLYVDFPFVMDDCNDIKYNIINGELFEGEGIFPLIQYHTTFDGVPLRVFN